MRNLGWRDPWAWFAASGLLVVIASGLTVAAFRLHLPPVLCTVPTAAEARALNEASDRVDRWADWAEVISLVGGVVAVVGVVLARRGRLLLALWVLVPLVVGLVAAGYAHDVPNRGCGI